MSYFHIISPLHQRYFIMMKTNKIYYFQIITEL